MNERDATKLIGKDVVANFTDGRPYGEGRVVGWYDRPTFVIERPDGSRFSWIDDMCVEATR